MQREANRLYGYTAQQTLDYLQSLYEKKLATYPRTDSQYLTEDMRGTANDLVTWLCGNMPFGKAHTGEPDLKRVTDNAKVTDHHAIIPTMQITKADLSALPAGERDILMLIAARLLCATAQAHQFEAVKAALSCAGHDFTAKGKTVLQAGWKEIESLFKIGLKQKEEKDDEDAALPELTEGQVFEGVAASVREGKTAPPKHYTEDTLLSAMETAGADETPDDAERKGLGTPATRAATLEKLVSTGFVERKKKQLIPTEKGVNLITVLPEKIKSPLLTAEWESMLKQVERGEISADAFMGGIADMTGELVKAHTEPDKQFLSLFPRKDTESEAVGTCPPLWIGGPRTAKGLLLREQGLQLCPLERQPVFSSKKENRYKIYRRGALKRGPRFVSGLYSEKTGKTYDAVVVLDDTGDKYVNFKLEFSDKRGGKK